MASMYIFYRVSGAVHPCALLGQLLVLLLGIARAPP